VPLEVMMADPAVAALAAAGDGEDAAGASVDADVAAAEDWPVKDDEIERRLGAAEPASPTSVLERADRGGGGGGAQGGDLQAMKAEAAARGYGKLYAAFGGGRAGLEACAAGMRPRPLWGLRSPSGQWVVRFVARAPESFAEPAHSALDIMGRAS